MAIERKNVIVKVGHMLIWKIPDIDWNEIPKNWLECDGSEISRTTYADLFAVIGTTFGVGDGSTTFNIPNLKYNCESYIIKFQNKRIQNDNT